jgi:hypothetical protein
MLENQNLAATQGLWLKDTAGVTANVTTSSQSFADLGLTITDDVEAVTVVIPSGAVYYNPAGTATTSNAALPSIYTVYRNEIVDTAEFIAASTIAMSMIVHTRASDIDGLGG